MRVFYGSYLKILFVIIISIFFSLSVTGIVTYSYFANDLKTRDGIMNKNDTGVILYDRNNNPFFTFYEAKKEEFVPLNKISPFLKYAVISVEDKDFYKHFGFSVRGIVRSFLNNIETKNFSSGGSTITQQLVKNSLLNSKKSYFRKYQEIILAREIEKRYAKDEILEMYLNSVYFGEGAFGAQEAAKTYFGKKASELSISEASFLAGILPSPSALSPYNGNWKKAFERQDIVLKKMVEQGYVAEDDVRIAKEKEIAFKQTDDTLNKIAPHFALMIKDELIKKFGEEYVVRSGLKVKTPIDISWQKFAEATVRENVKSLSGNNVSNGAAVVMDAPTGEVRALVGSVDWFDDKFGKMNMAISPRQPGSSFKPIVYATAFERKTITPATVLKDEPTEFKLNEPGAKSYKPQDYDSNYRGKVLARRALANSLNIPAVEVLYKVGINNVIEKSREFGINLDEDYYGLSLALGTAEIPLIKMTQAYNVFANEGKFVKAKIINQVEDKNGNIVFKENEEPKVILDQGSAFLIWSILSDRNARRELFGNALDSTTPAAVKTGTSQSYRDAWTLGFTPSLTVGVWVGNNDNRPMSTVAGSLGAAPIFRILIDRFSKDYPRKTFGTPAEIVQLSICASNGLVAFGNSSGAATMEFFLTGTEPVAKCNVAVNPRPQKPIASPPTLSEEEKKKLEEAQKEAERQKDNSGPGNSEDKD